MLSCTKSTNKSKCWRQHSHQPPSHAFDVWLVRWEEISQVHVTCKLAKVKTKWKIYTWEWSGRQCGRLQRCLKEILHYTTISDIVQEVTLICSSDTDAGGRHSSTAYQGRYPKKKFLTYAKVQLMKSTKQYSGTYFQNQRLQVIAKCSWNQTLSTMKPVRSTICNDASKAPLWYTSLT